MPECRANNLPGWTQGGSSGDVIVGHFALNYHNEASQLGVDLNDVYSAMLADGELNPTEWDVQGRQVNVYKLVLFQVFSGTLLLVKATSPLTATFVAVPRSAFQLVAISLFKAPAQTWLGVVLCWISSLWFLVARRNEGRNRHRLRLEGR